MPGRRIGAFIKSRPKPFSAPMQKKAFSLVRCGGMLLQSCPAGQIAVQLIGGTPAGSGTKQGE
ncbi:hypothetical protein SMB34_16050 [Thalassospira permensis NBRC 106175]|uniref:Uncharacterized protein n=1 Tax=Thalassospira permensis NBRC 106175 TaxID=1353532 RepID=A0ABR4TQR6_9PROT|nr:hypothetical protein SMB34_16050 [Thalassospira permensis NBRC 106175]